MPAHQSALAAASEFFRQLFAVDTSEKCMHEITLRDIDGHTMEQLIEFCYIDTVKLSPVNAEHILYQANRYSLRQLEVACIQYFAQQMNVQNCAATLVLAESLSIDDLQQIAWDFVVANFMEVSQTAAFNRLDADTLHRILSSDAIEVRSEANIFECIVNWIRCDEANRKMHLRRLSATLRLADIDRVSNFICEGCDFCDRKTQERNRHYFKDARL